MRTGPEFEARSRHELRVLLDELLALSGTVPLQHIDARGCGDFKEFLAWVLEREGEVTERHSNDTNVTYSMRYTPTPTTQGPSVRCGDCAHIQSGRMRWM